MRATVLCLHQRSSLLRHTLPSTTEGLILLKLTWNKHLWDLSGASDETHTHRFMQVRHPSQHDSKKSMTPSTLKKAQQTHKQTQTKLFSIFLLLPQIDICTGGKRKPRHLQFINATCLWSLPSCVLSDQGDAIRVWTCLLSGFYNSVHLRGFCALKKAQLKPNVSEDLEENSVSICVQKGCEDLVEPLWPSKDSIDLGKLIFIRN